MDSLPAPPATHEAELDRRRLVVRGAGVILLMHAVLLGWVSYVSSPNLDEPAHLAAGISYWTFGRFDLYRVNPPLVRLIASAPVLATNFKSDWADWQTGSPDSRSEFQVGRSFVLKNGADVFWYFTLARGACIPLCLIGAGTVFLWARDLYGDFAGLMALWLYCYCPNMIAWGASITPDAAGASLGALAAYAFWRWLQRPNWARAAQAGLTLGLSELAKGTWIVLFVVFPFVWLVHWLSMRGRRSAAGNGTEKGVVISDLGARNDSSPKQEAPNHSFARNPIARRSAFAFIAPLRQLAAILLLAIYVLNLGYGFEGTFKALHEFRFVSRTLSGEDSPHQGANRFADLWIGRIPVPLPENYVLGLDAQKLDFERGAWSYLCGEQRYGGWWYYYLAAFSFKSPIGTLVIFGVATGMAILHRNYRADWRSELAFLFPAVAVLALVSSETGFNRYLRYALPFAPFAYIHCSRVALAFDRRHLTMSTVVFVCALATAVESLSVYPHSMSFFNRLAGGPAGGHAYLLDSNIDWAQDILFLKKWYDANPQARPFHLERFGSLVASPEAAGIESKPVPGYLPADAAEGNREFPSGPRPGWFALSINHIKGYRHYSSDRPEFTYFQGVTPIARVGYSIYIFHLTRDDANALRSKLGLEPLPLNNALPAAI